MYYELTFKNEKFFISDNTIKAFILLLSGKEVKLCGKINNGKIIYIESDKTTIEINQIIKSFVNRYEYLSIYAVNKNIHMEPNNKSIVKNSLNKSSGIKLPYNKLVKDAYRHNKLYPNVD